MKKLRMLGLMVLVNFASGCIPAAINLLLVRDTPWRVLLRQCQWGWIYATCIGTLCFFVVERIASRLRRLPRWLQIPAFLAVFLLVAMVGTLPAR